MADVKVDVKRSPLVQAILSKDLNRVEQELRNPHIRLKVDALVGGKLPLHYAIESGDLEILECLLKYGADPNAVAYNNFDPNSGSALHLAVRQNNIDVIKILLRNGGNTSVRTQSGKSALQIDRLRSIETAQKELLEDRKPARISNIRPSTTSPDLHGEYFTNRYSNADISSASPSSDFHLDDSHSMFTGGSPPVLSTAPPFAAEPTFSFKPPIRSVPPTFTQERNGDNGSPPQVNPRRPLSSPPSPPSGMKHRSSFDEDVKTSFRDNFASVSIDNVPLYSENFEDKHGGEQTPIGFASVHPTTEQSYAEPLMQSSSPTKPVGSPPVVGSPPPSASEDPRVFPPPFPTGIPPPVGSAPPPVGSAPSPVPPPVGSAPPPVPPPVGSSPSLFNSTPPAPFSSTPPPHVETAPPAYTTSTRQDERKEKSEIKYSDKVMADLEESIRSGRAALESEAEKIGQIQAKLEVMENRRRPLIGKLDYAQQNLSSLDERISSLKKQLETEVIKRANAFSDVRRYRDELKDTMEKIDEGSIALRDAEMSLQISTKYVESNVEELKKRKAWVAEMDDSDEFCEDLSDYDPSDAPEVPTEEKYHEEMKEFDEKELIALRLRRRQDTEFLHTTWLQLDMMQQWNIILGVQKNDPKDVITKSFRKLMRQYHPDKNSLYYEKSNEMMQLVQQAHDIAMS